METNPYKPPHSNVERIEEPEERSIWWKIYFWFIFVAQCLYAGWIIFDPEGAEAVPIDYFDLLVYVFVLLALFGFAYSKQFLTRKIWQYFFPFIIIWDIWLTYIDFEFRDFINLGITPIIIFSVVLVVIIIPQYVALYRYAYREYGLWLAK